MARPQPVLSPLSPAAIFLVATIDDGPSAAASVHDALAELSGLVRAVGFRVPDAALRRAIELNPSLTKAHQQLGTTRYLAGDPQSAIEPLDTAIRLSPNDQHLFIQLGEMAMAQLMRGDMKKAIDYANHALLHRPNYWYAHLVRICASEELGDADQIGRAVSAFATTETRLTERHFEWVPFRDRKWIRKLRNTAESAIDRAYMIQSQSQGGARNGKAD